MYIPWKSKRFLVCFAKSFVFYAIRRGAEADFVNIHKCAPFDSSFLYRSMHPGLAVKGGFAHSSAMNGFLDDYFFLLLQLYCFFKLLRRIDRRPAKLHAPGFCCGDPFAGEPSANVGKNFLRSYAGVCLQGVVIALACIIFSTIAVTDPAVDSSVSAVTAVWSYVGELVFNLLILVGAIKGCDRIVKEIMGL